MEKLAKIENATLEIQERGILNFWIHVKYEDGLNQGVGGISLDRYCEKTKSRIGTSYGCEVIRSLLIELGVNDFSEMKGKKIWVIGEGDGFQFKPAGIRSLLVDNKNSSPVIFAEIMDMFDDNGEKVI